MGSGSNATTAGLASPPSPIGDASTDLDRWGISPTCLDGSGRRSTCLAREGKRFGAANCGRHGAFGLDAYVI
jgi:hypothetical protein